MPIYRRTTDQSTPFRVSNFTNSGSSLTLTHLMALFGYVVVVQGVDFYTSAVNPVTFQCEAFTSTGGLFYANEQSFGGGFGGTGWRGALPMQYHETLTASVASVLSASIGIVAWGIVVPDLLAAV